jgi:hypothetical protein
MPNNSASHLVVGLSIFDRGVVKIFYFYPLVIESNPFEDSFIKLLS